MAPPTSDEKRTELRAEFAHVKRLLTLLVVAAIVPLPAIVLIAVIFRG